MKDLRIIFMGTPEIAVASLKILVENEYNVVAVVTIPDKPAGRGQKLQESDVKKYAVSVNIPVLQPEKLKNEQFVSELQSFQADLFIVVAFRMLPEIVWNMPRLGTFNLHASLLPQYRGAAPINHAIMNGEKKSGVTTFFIQHEIDTGGILFQEVIDILPKDNAGTYHDKLMYAGAQLVLKTVEAIENGVAVPKTQSSFISKDTELKNAPKIFKENCQINWNNSAEKIHDFVRGLSPYPSAFGLMQVPKIEVPQSFKVFETEPIADSSETKAGTVKSDGKKFVEIKCGENAIRLKDIQLSGKKRMKIDEFLRGFPYEIKIVMS